MGAHRVQPHNPSPPEGDPPSPQGLFECPNGHDSPIAISITDMGEKINGDYCMVCWMQFIAHHTPRVRLVKFNDD